MFMRYLLWARSLQSALLSTDINIIMLLWSRIFIILQDKNGSARLGDCVGKIGKWFFKCPVLKKIGGGKPLASPPAKAHRRTISQKLCEQKVCKFFISATLLVGISPRNLLPYVHRGACKRMLMAVVLEIQVGRQTKEYPKTLGHSSRESGGLRICKYNVRRSGVFNFLIRYFCAFKQRWVTL